MSGDVILDVEDQQVLIVEGDAGPDVLDAEPEVFFLAAGEQGPAGVGVAGGVITRSAVANGNLSGHRAVYINGSGAAYSSSDNLSTARTCVGITTGAALSGDTATVATFGKVDEPSWAWTEGPVYLGLAGALTQTLPTSGAIVEIGIAVSATELEVRVQPPINLA